MAGLRAFLEESGQEFRRVRWLSRAETIRMVLVVIGLSAAVGAFIYLWDQIFFFALKSLLG
ncbi:MAG TPA: preprotein translocase subunit SecE [Candidatus Tyrphobacter sp.]|nr:preprotein translocase subunit SecE [Candidatus Tyrphobacter sp.]